MTRVKVIITATTFNEYEKMYFEIIKLFDHLAPAGYADNKHTLTSEEGEIIEADPKKKKVVLLAKFNEEVPS